MSILGDLTIDHLRYLVAVAKHGGVQAAADALGVSQPTVSKQMKHWRERRPPLLGREAGRDVLTERGQQVVATAQQILRQIDQLSRFLREQEDAPTAVYIAGGAVASQWYLAPTMARLAKEFPDFRFRTRVMRGSDRITGVVGGEIDLAVVSHDKTQIEMIAGPRRLKIEPLVKQPMCVVCQKKTEQAKQLSRILKGQEVPLALLSEWPLVGPDSNSGIRRYLEGKARSAGNDLQFIAESGGWHGAKEYARCGIGVAILPLAFLDKDDLNDLVARRLTGSVSIGHSLIRRSDDKREIIQQVCEMMRTVSARHVEKSARRWHGIL